MPVPLYSDPVQFKVASAWKLAGIALRRDRGLLIMTKFFKVAALSAAAFAFTLPVCAQVSTDNPKGKPMFTCKAVNAQGQTFNGAAANSAGAARELALKECMRAKDSRKCKVDSCIG